jgi:hypothetical protein
VASAYIEFWRAYRSEHGKPQTLKANAKLAKKAGELWQSRFEKNPRPRHGTYDETSPKFYTVFRNGHMIHIPVRPALTGAGRYNKLVDDWWSKNRKYKKYSDAFKKTGGVKHNPFPDCQICGNPLLVMPNTVAVGCEQCGAVYGVK